MPQRVGRKVPIRTWAVNGLLFMLLLDLASCGPIVRRAPFPQRPDSVMVGAFVGPFEGRVVDTDTDQPIADVVVGCSWSFSRGLGNTAQETVRSAETRTDVDGRYRVAPLSQFPQGLSTRLSSFSLLVYKKGYVAYRHDRMFGCSARGAAEHPWRAERSAQDMTARTSSDCKRRRRRTFSQLNNQVRLSRWSPELSHAEHLLFIGTAPPVLAASRWEVTEAVAELGGRRRLTPLSAALDPVTPSTAPATGLDASVLLSSDDVRTTTGYTGAFSEGRLAGERSAIYDTFHLRAVDLPERYDVALRLWRLADDELTAKYEEVMGKLEGARQNDEIADRSFSVQQGEILGLGFIDRASGAMVLITCGKGQCASIDSLTKLTRKVQNNLRRLPPLKGERGPLPEAQPESETPQEDEE